MADPYPTYAALRAAGRVCRVSPASWGITRHADVAALLRDPRLGNEFPEGDPQFRMDSNLAGDVFRRIIPTRDPADHGRLHQLIVKAFSPGVARRMRERIAGLVDELLVRGLDTGRLDGVADLAFPLAATVVCELIGIPAGSPAEIWPRSAALGKAFTPFLPEGDDRAEADAALAWLRGYVEDLLAHHRPDPDGDLLGRLLAAAAADPASYPEADIVDNVVFLCFTGFETTMNMVCTGCVGLSTHPDQWRALRADRALAPSAVEEFVRYDSPIQYTARLALEPFEVGDRLIRRGRSVFLLLGCANHDEAVFDQPQRLDMGVAPTRMWASAAACVAAWARRWPVSRAASRSTGSRPGWPASNRPDPHCANRAHCSARTRASRSPSHPRERARREDGLMTAHRRSCRQIGCRPARLGGAAGPAHRGREAAHRRRHLRRRRTH